MSLSGNRVYQGDCLDLFQNVDPGSVDMVFADPPFNIGYEYDVYDDEKQSGDYLQWCRDWIQGVHRTLKSTGTFWLAIGDEYAAELKIESQKAGFHCRSWVIWYYTFGVNCANGFSRSHTHLFHFVKDKKNFTFNRTNPQIRVKSARQLVYADNRANPNGRLPDNTWIMRPQDAPLSFSPVHDTWYFARVAGTFKEREGFHGCQMPEQLLARIIRASSRPQDLVLDPFGGSGTTMCVAKKLGRQWMGFELSGDYAKFINERLERTSTGDPIEGPVDPIESAPSTANGKRRKKPFNQKTEEAVIDAFKKAGRGYPADYILCDKEINQEFISECRERGIGGSATIWNRYLLQLRKAGKLPKSTKRPDRISPAEMSHYGFASEIAWRLISIDYRKTLDDILCSPDFASEFDRLASIYGPENISSREYRCAALSIRKRTKPARLTARMEYGDWSRKKMPRIAIEDVQNRRYECPGVFVVCTENAGIYAGESNNLSEQIKWILEHPGWQDLKPDSVYVEKSDQSFSKQCAMKSALVGKINPLLNCRLWVSDSELS